MSLQAFGVVRSNSSPEIVELKEPPYIITPVPSVSQLSLKDEVKGISHLPVLPYRDEAGGFLDRQISLHCLKKTLSNLHFL